MYPTVYHMFQDWFGIEGGNWAFLKMLNSFGLFVAFAFIVANYLLKKEIIRKQNDGLLQGQKVRVTVGKPAHIVEYVINGIVGLVVGHKLLGVILDKAEMFEDPPKYLLSSRGYILGGIILAAILIFLKFRESQKNKLPEPKEVEREKKPVEHLGAITMIAAVFGIIGAKLFHLLEEPEQFMEFFQNPTVEGFIGGLTMYGGLIVGAIAVTIYLRKHKLNVLRLYDAAAPGLILAYAIGRIGCQVAGDGDWGIDNPDPMPAALSFLPEWMWAYDYPNNVLNMDKGVLMTEGVIFEGYGHHLATPVFPTPFYETVMSTIIFVVLWRIRKRIAVPGMLFAIYLFFNGVERFLIEFIRINSEYEIFGVAQAQIISFGLILLGAGAYYYLLKKSKGRVESKQPIED